MPTTLFHILLLRLGLLLSLLSVGASKNRIRHVPQIDPDAPPSVVWTEVIDEKNVKLAALSFRVILPSMSNALWITEALSRAGIDTQESSCKVSIFLVNAGGGVIDFQHARGSLVVKKQYSKIKLYTKLVDESSSPDQNTEAVEDCTWLIGQGYATVVCSIASDFQCESLYESRHILTLREFMNESVPVSKSVSQLQFEIEAQHTRKTISYTSKIKNPNRRRSEKVYGVVAHVGLKNLATSIQVEAWIRFHISRGFKLFLFDRYAFHRDIVAQALNPWTQKNPVGVMQKYIDPFSLPTEMKKNNLGPVPKNDPVAYKKRRAMRSQHGIIYYTVPAEHKNMNEHKLPPGRLVYANFTPYELVRRTTGDGELLVPYFDKPATFLFAAHENPGLEMIFLLDVDEYLDCSDDIDVILSSHKEYEPIDEIRVPRRVIPTTMTFEDCSKLEYCTYPDIWGNQYRWQKFDKVGVKSLEVPDISIHGTQTPHYHKNFYPNNHTFGHMPAWDCSVEHLNPSYFGPNIKARSVVKYFEKNRGPWQWGLTKDKIDETRSTRGLFPPIRQQQAFLRPDSLPLRGAGYDKKGHMQPGYVTSLYTDVRASLEPYEMRGFRQDSS